MTTTALPSSPRPHSRPPVVAVSMGDPLGIGPEIIVKALADPDLRRRAAFLLFGLDQPLRSAAGRAAIPAFWAADAAPTAPLSPGDVILSEPRETAATFNRLVASAQSPAHAPSPLGGHSSIEFLTAAMNSTMLPLGHPRRATALATAPISKTSWNLAGLTRYPGHTEVLAACYAARRHAMLFVGRTLNVILVTIHIPLAAVPAAVTTLAVLDAIELAHQAAATLSLATTPPRIAVCGLNPHAGEHGLLGDEDDQVILPAIGLARSRGIDASGPFPADSVFLDAARGSYDLVVAMYHDQGLIPIKLLEREHTVNVTVGLPHPHPSPSSPWLVRTSPAHGTAFDIAGRNLADETSMKAALHLAINAGCPRPAQ